MKFIGRIFARIFGWWSADATIGTLWYTLLAGKKVGEDGDGNRYYTNKKNTKRWVIYNGEIEASRIPPDWHAWIHKTVDMPPSQMPLAHKEWEKPHPANLTGTAMAEMPPAAKGGERAKATGDYEAWTP